MMIYGVKEMEDCINISCINVSCWMLFGSHSSFAIYDATRRSKSSIVFCNDVSLLFANDSVQHQQSRGAPIRQADFQS